MVAKTLRPGHHTKCLPNLVGDVSDLPGVVEADLPCLGHVLPGKVAATVDPVRKVGATLRRPPTEATPIFVAGGLRGLLFLGLPFPDGDDPTLHGGVVGVEHDFDFGAGPDLGHDVLPWLVTRLLYHRS